ncbi:MAG: FAD-dependent oxidoreductase, partial [Sinobacterium sp.]|nr:FAD-dependent oxidoreductase [Sinobacterium sp.]
IQADLCIIGGGIAGLWTLALAHSRGIQAILFEKDCLGSKQTICSQGIIHGGSKYTLQGKITGATDTISGMPKHWLDALSGKGEVNLSNTTVLSNHQFMVPSSGIETKLLSFLGSKTMSSFTQKVKGQNLPSGMQTAGIKHPCFQLFEPVVAVDSLLENFQQQFSDYIYQYEVKAADISEHENSLSLNLQNNAGTIQCQKILLCSGEGFETLAPLCPKQKMQKRPLHMIAVTGSEKTLPPLYTHFVGRSSKPLLTVTSHPHAATHTNTWYLGGNLAELGVERSHDSQVEQAKQLMQKLTPAVDCSKLTFKSIFIDRAEPAQNNLIRPDDAYLASFKQLMVAWPTKLALAPRLAEKALFELNSTLSKENLKNLAQLPLSKPSIATYPWLST